MERFPLRIPQTRSVLFRLIGSYAALVLLMTVTTSGVAFFYFQSKYNEELEKFPQLYVKNIAKEIETRIVDESKSLYMEISGLLNLPVGGLFSPDDKVEGLATKLVTSVGLLQGIASRNYDRIEAVHLYYVKQQILLSSTGFHTQIEAGSPLITDTILQEMMLRNLSQKWELYHRPAYLGIPAMSLFRSHRCFPILSTPEDCSLLITIEFQSDYLRGILTRLMPEDGGETVLVNAAGTEFFGDSEKSPWDPRAWSVFRQDLNTTAPDRVQARLVPGSEGTKLLTALALADSGWYLVNVISPAKLYKRGDVIWLVLVLIGVVASLVGLAVSGWLSAHIYTPLKNLMARLGTVFGVPTQDPERDEYQMISSALDQISNRMEGLEATIVHNKSAIKNEMVLRLLEEEQLESEEWLATLTLLNLPEFSLRLRAGLVTLATPTRVLKYHLADELEAAFPSRLWASPMPAGGIGLIFGIPGEADGLAPLEEHLRLMRDRTGTPVTMALGPVVTSPTDLGLSFAQAQQLAEFHFLFPETVLFADRDDLSGRKGRSALPGKDFLSALTAALSLRDQARIEVLLDQFHHEARTGQASVQACRADLEWIALTLAGPTSELPGLLSHTDSIEEFLKELKNWAADQCSGGNARQQRSAVLTQRIKAYVEENLGRDLSLDAVGSALAVSPGYMSKIFKEESGQNFVGFVTEARLVRAAQLLESVREPVQDIGRAVGIPSPAYFIRLFKGKYGKTPLDYRRERFQEQKNPEK